jgi:hypothetical protein
MVDQVCRRSTFDIIIILYAQDYFSYIIYESMYNFLVQFGSSACSTEVDRDEFALSFFIFVATTTRLYCIGIAIIKQRVLETLLVVDHFPIELTSVIFKRGRVSGAHEPSYLISLALDTSQFQYLLFSIPFVLHSP